jgi:hypothetical protein
VNPEFSRSGARCATAECEPSDSLFEARSMLTESDLWIAGICLALIILLTCLGNLGNPKDKY